MRIFDIVNFFAKIVILLIYCCRNEINVVEVFILKTETHDTFLLSLQHSKLKILRE